MNDPSKSIAEAHTFKDLIFRTNTAVRELGIDWKNNEDIKKLILRLIRLKP
jgi:hypothetical protein